MSSDKYNQRGRPPKGADERRIQVNVRLLVADRDRLQSLAAESARPLASEAESILAKHLARSDETNALLDRIALNIRDLELRAQGKWHKNLKAWAAVSEMLGQVADIDRPESLLDDEIIAAVKQQLRSAEEFRLMIISKLSDHGISVKLDPRPEPLLGRHRLRGIFGNSENARSPRLWERAAIEAMPEDSIKSEAVELFEMLCDCDERIAKFERDLDDAIRPYIEAEQAGRRLAKPCDDLLVPLPNALATAGTPVSTLLSRYIGKAVEEEEKQ